ncbi:MAG TPA: Ig-like domain-containing protein [Aeromicrobium sp.]|nr:Ig-like domain-containing protein [Aeromicrobium sp.]
MKFSDFRLVVAFFAALVLASCTAGDGTGKSPLTALAQKDPLTISVSVADGASAVPVDERVFVDGFDGQLESVKLETAGQEPIPGTIHGVRWTADELLEPGVKYVVTASGTGDDGKIVTKQTSFTTQALPLDKQTYPSIAPLAGETVGVGMPVIVSFDVAVKDRAAFEKNMTVTATPATEGGWYWLSDHKAHWRPKDFWQPGTQVSVDLALNSVPAGDGVYGQQDQHLSFKIGRSVVSVVDIKRHTMAVAIDGTAAKTIPVSTGDAKNKTREGIKVVMEKFASVNMDAASTGVDSTDPGYYNLSGVKWAMRVTNTGEFIHAAPWSASFHGRANVSHGCVGMSTENAAWLYRQSKRGDVIKFVGSGRKLEPGNGWTDWNRSWDDWLQGSALATASTAATASAAVS